MTAGDVAPPGEQRQEVVVSLGRIGTSAAVVSGTIRRNEMGIVRRIVVSALALGLCTLAFGGRRRPDR